MSPEEAALADKLYQALAYAETGNEKNPWIRTRHRPEEGSSAFGPVQITRKKLWDYMQLDRYQDKFTDEDLAFAQASMLPMQRKMLDFGGGETHKEGYDPIYEYGRGGGFDVANEADNYEALAKKMILIDFLESGGNTEGLLKRWRANESDKRYYDAFNKKLQELGGL